MASPREEQAKLLSYLDGIMACIENYPLFNLETPFLDAGVAVNAMSLLMLLLGKFYTQEEIIEWISKFLIYTLPVLEVGVKGVILSNLKLSISCNIDPWIPDEWRQHMFSDDHDTQSVSENPCLIPVSTIDYRNMLQINPVSKLGQEYYYKTKIEYTHQSSMPMSEFAIISGDSYAEVYEEVLAQKNSVVPSFMGSIWYNPDNIKQTGDITNVYQLARADDMNAFLWFVMNKGVYLDANATNIESQQKPENAITMSTIPKDAEGEIKVNDLESNKIEIYTSGDIVTTARENNSEKVGSTNYLICYDGKAETTGDEFSYYYHLIPCSNRRDSYNWYVNRKNYMQLLTQKDIERNYDEEFPICNFSCKGADGKITNNPSTNSYIQVKVLPKPMLHYRKAFWVLEKNGIEAPIPFKKVLFDAEGNIDKKGKFTVKPKTDADGKVMRPAYTQDGETIYELDSTTLAEGKYPYLLIVKDGKYEIKKAASKKTEKKVTDDKGKTKIYYEYKYAEGELKQEYFVNDCLFPCYPGLTVYEFNYDYVMGQRLFDAKTIAYKIFKTLMGFRLGLPPLSMSETIYQMRISEIIQNIMESDAYEVSDCFFSFSNEKFTSMLNEAEKRRAQKYPFADDEHDISISGEEVIEILNQFDEKASLVEQTDVFQRAFTQATANITQEVLPEDKLNIGMDFILEAVKVLGVTLFECLISPKMLLLFEVNKRLMGEPSDEYPTIEQLLTQLASMISAIIAEIMETIIAELMAFLMKKIGEILAKLAAMLTLEQLTFYKELLEKLIKACSFKFPLFGHRANLDSQIDVVQYADIDPIDTPKTDEC